MSAPVAELLADALPDHEVVVRARPDEGYWLVSNGEAPDFRVRSIAGSPCVVHPERPREVAEALDQAAPLIDRIEGVTGWLLEPSDLQRRGPACAIAIRSGEVEVELALQPGSPATARLFAAAAKAEPSPRRKRPRLLLLEGPRLTIEEAADLAPGDLLLLPTVLNGTFAGEDDLALSLDLEAGRLRPSRWERAEQAGLAVTLHLSPSPLRLDDEELALIRAGGEVSTGPLADGMPLLLDSAGRPFGAGTLTRLGRATAILVTAIGGERDA